MVLNSRWTHPISRLDPFPPSQVQRETLKTAATTDPFDAAALRSFARLDDYGEDAELTSAIRSAVGFVERELGVAILPQTWTLTIEGEWPDGGVIPWRAPFRSIDSATTVRALDDDEDWLEADYMVRPGGVIKCLNSDRCALGEDDHVEIDYVAGYADAASVPAALMTAIKIVAHEHYVWNRDVQGAAPPKGWPGASWDLAKDYAVFRGVGADAQNER